MNPLSITNLGELKKAGYQSKSIHNELRNNLIQSIQKKETIFRGILGYENTVIPEVERAILSGHSINLLGLRGQAKTKIARLMINLLDEYIPIISSSEINDDPFQPLSHYGKKIVSEMGDKTPISWLHRKDRYIEKLATPDVSIADLIGDLDPVKAINEKLNYSDERAIHFGLIPRSNRCIFVINELPDLQARIQVALFNILQEGDIQIRGFKLRLPLDMQFVFTANPEDYTNRGSIVTPLKDRIGSQIMTHYPNNIETAAAITRQEAELTDFQRKNIQISETIEHILENIVDEARKSEFVDIKSGVSTRLGISAYELLFSSAERRMIVAGDKNTQIRISDIQAIVPAMTGKIEMVFEGETEGPINVANNLIGKALKNLFEQKCPPLEKMKKKGTESQNLYKHIIHWFDDGNHLDIPLTSSNSEHESVLNSLDVLNDFCEQHFSKLDKNEKSILKELILFGLSENSKLSRQNINQSIQFKDLFGSVFSGFSE
jgi:magnesium chelatase subunit I